MKNLFKKHTKLALLLFFLFSITWNANAGDYLVLNVLCPSKTISIVKNKNAKLQKKQQRKQLKKWTKSNRKKLGFGAGLLSVFALLGWRRKIKKLKKKAKFSSEESNGDDDGCTKIFLFIFLICVVSLGSRWVLEHLFGVMVGFWTGALLGFLTFALLLLLITLIVKAFNR